MKKRGRPSVRDYLVGLQGLKHAVKQVSAGQWGDMDLHEAVMRYADLVRRTERP